MTRADHAHHLINTLRREKNPPLTRYSVIIALLRCPRQTVSGLAALEGEEVSYISGTLENCLRRGLVTRDAGGLLLATPEGADHVRHLLDPNHVPA